MAPALIGIAGFAAVLLLMLLRVPVAVSMGVVGAAGFLFLQGWDGLAYVMGSSPFESVFPYSLSVVPLFVMMGVFASYAGLSRQLYDAAYAFLGHYRGGLALATVGACAGFGAICGSAIATAATMCRVALPEMRRHGYADSLATASIAAGGTLGILIPPSIILLIYALLTEQSLGKLFVAALLPGLLGTVLYMAAILVATRINPALGPAGDRMNWPQRLQTLRSVWPVALLFLLVIGGMYTGWFSPNEAASVGAVGALIFALAGRTMGLDRFKQSLLETASTSAMIFLIIIGAGLFNFFLEGTNVPQYLIQEVQHLQLSPTLFLLLLTVFYIVLGALMDDLAMILLTLPFVFPVTQALSIDPIWFGIYIVTIVEIGMIVPPVGMNLFVIQGVGQVKLQTVIRGILPFVLADIVRIALLISVPQIALFLPQFMD
ncbi:TRAP transporter large permease [uncultured Ferrovibrio sp.]|jgi:tripartite ATP-independent transporter DctM subunit|uniref:TRAP transporter large permease n=1 Tax=uncultured Ferrovibrio sp. TaxID=1576913 RepID=UPI00260E8DD5|nr:TRAP transporter large permease [uncultured Ferrovibrio sp.]